MSRQQPRRARLAFPLSAQKRRSETLQGDTATAIASWSDEGPALAMEPARTENEYRPQTGDILHGRFNYRIVSRLGRGAFGSVYLAECLEASPLGRRTRLDLPPSQVAIKVLGPTRSEKAKSFLKRELAALLAIQAPQIPILYDWSLENEAAFSVVEYFPSGSLADAWPLIGRFDEQQCWRLISDLLSALSAAHRASILHLDVKPSNVLLDGDGGFVLTDFGVSHASRMSQGLLSQGGISVGLGTHGYRAPEQDNCEVHSFDLRTDLWGVGATAWGLYTGIDLTKRRDVLRKAEDGNVFGLQRLSDVRINCPPPLEEVVMGLLHIDPALRPGGASEVLGQIRTVAQGFGLDSQTIASARRENMESGEVQQLINSMVDPLWASICRTPGFERYFVRFEEGETLSCAGPSAHQTFLLLKGAVSIERDGKQVDVERREGTLMGAVSALTGAPRRVQMRAIEGPVWVCIFNEAELEQLVTCNSSVAVRMIRSMAQRLVESPDRHGV